MNSHVQDQAHRQYSLPYPENYEHREERAPKDRLEQRGQMLFESDSEDSSGELQELDFNCFCSSEEENYSI